VIDAVWKNMKAMKDWKCIISMLLDDDESNSERSLASKVCAFTSSGSNFIVQHWYFCYTCDLTISKVDFVYDLLQKIYLIFVLIK
jgi:hypothetical protein